MIAACILIQTQAGQAAIVAAARRDLLRVSETGEAGRPLRRHLRQARDIGKVLRTHVARGRTLFLSIHQISDAARFCDRFVLLSAGRVCGEGTVAELVRSAAERDASRSYETLEEVFLALT